jgi:hypothetical protein
MQRSNSTQEAKFAMIADWQQSGLSQRQYCQERNIVYHSFHYWYKKFRDEQPQKPARAGSFIQLEPAAMNNIPFAEFISPGGGRILFHQPVGTEYLKALAG